MTNLVCHCEMPVITLISQINFDKVVGTECYANSHIVAVEIKLKQ